MKQNWMIVGAVAAMMAAASAATYAQTTPDATAPPMAAPAAPMTPAAPMEPDTSMSSPPGAMLPVDQFGVPTVPGPPTTDVPPDYTLLANRNFGYTEIHAAKAKGFSDSQIASMIRISKLSGDSFQSVVDMVLNGTTFATIAETDNLKLSDVIDPPKEKAELAAYEAAYQTSGYMALKQYKMANEAAMSSSSMPMTPSTTTAMPMTPMAPTKDVVQAAMSEKKFSTLVKLLKQANLVDALEGPGPFTVFAPTNDAFKKLPKGTLKKLTPDQLTAILKYHVLPAKVDAATAMAMSTPTSPPTLEGSTLQVTSGSGKVMINDATVTQADIMATNGIVHAIDTVLMPPDMPTDASAMPMTTPDSTGTTPPVTTGPATGSPTSSTPDTTSPTTPVAPPAPAPPAAPAQ